MIARSPATDIFYDDRFGPEYESRICETNRRLRQMAIDSSEKELAGKPMESYGCSFVSWEHDALITCDFPVMPCNLFDIHKHCKEYRERGMCLDGYIFPLSPRGLFTIFNLEDAEIFQREFCQTAGLMNPIAINCIATHYALEYLMARSSDQINQDLIDKIPSNPESDLAYEYMTRLRRTSKYYDPSERGAGRLTPSGPGLHARGAGRSILRRTRSGGWNEGINNHVPMPAPVRALAHDLSSRSNVNICIHHINKC